VADKMFEGYNGFLVDCFSGANARTEYTTVCEL
jgi:hypothetical protein